MLWGEPVPCRNPGVYVVALSAPLERAPIDAARVRAWLNRVSGLMLDGARPTASALISRLEQFWWPQSEVIYIGCTTATIEKRVGAFVRHELGNRSPHRGGHWIKTLTPGAALRVWWSEAGDPVVAEGRLIAAFRQVLVAGFPNLAGTSPANLLPFCNLTTETGAVKPHGLASQVLG